MEIVQHSKRVTNSRRSLEFIDLQAPAGCSLAFDCDETGRPDFKSKAAQANYELCLSDPQRYIPQGVQTFTWSYTQPAVGRCACGAKVTLDCFTNTCECGADYNMSGQRLAARHLWGEETGEHYSECI